MSWRNKPMTISRGRLVGVVIAGGFLAATLSLLLSVILFAVLSETPVPLLGAVVVVFAVRTMISLVETACFSLRRRARLRRIRR